MARRRSTKRPYGEPHPELDVDALRGGLGARRETGPRGEEYFVAVPRPNDKVYICPGCGQEIDGETPHLVAWPTGSIFGDEAAAAARRHWHTNCWNSFGRTRG